MITKYYPVPTDVQHLEQILTADPLGRKLSFFVCSHDLARGSLKSYFQKRGSALKIIDDSAALESEIQQVQTRIKYVEPLKKLRAKADSLLNPFKISIKAFGIDVAYTASSRTGSDNGSDQSRVVYIRQDKIKKEQMSRLASLYYDIPREAQPIFFFEPSDEGTFDPISLASLNRHIEVKNLSREHIGVRAVQRQELVSVDDFVRHFLQSSFSACVQAENIFPTPADYSGLEPEAIVKALSVECMLIKSHDHLYNKFAAIPVAQRLQQKIQSARSYLKTEREQNYLLCLGAIVNLWLAYIDESRKECLDQSLAMAEYLQNEYLKAHCWRLAHLISGYGSVTRDLVEKAVTYFRANADHEAYIYAKNNFLLNALNSDEIRHEEFSTLVDFSNAETPYIDRLSAIVNNAGTACLLARNYDQAMLFYQQARKKAGHPIHHLGIEVNMAICRYLSGEVITGDEVLRLHRSIARSHLPREYDYHQSYLHWNLLRLCDFQGEAAEAIRNHLRESKFMDYENVLEGKTTMVDFLTTRMRHVRPYGRFPGPRGEFIHRTHLFPVVHYTWM